MQPGYVQLGDDGRGQPAAAFGYSGPAASRSSAGAALGPPSGHGDPTMLQRISSALSGTSASGQPLLIDRLERDSIASGSAVAVGGGSASYQAFHSPSRTSSGPLALNELSAAAQGRTTTSSLLLAPDNDPTSSFTPLRRSTPSDRDTSSDDDNDDRPLTQQTASADTAAEPVRVVVSESASRMRASSGGGGGEFAAAGAAGLEETSAPRDLDKTLERAYQYYEGRGFYPIVLSSITGLLTTGFLNMLFGFLTTYVNYSILFGEPTNNSLGRAIANPQLNVAGLVFFVLFWAFWLFELAAVLLHVKAMRKMKQFFHQCLHVSESELLTVEWSVVARRLLAVPRLCMEKPDWNELDLANRLLREDNFLVVMLNRRVLDLSLPGLPRTRLFTSVTLWVLRFVLMKWIFSKDRRSLMHGMAKNDQLLRERLSGDLQSYVRVWGVASLLAAPLFFLWRVWSSFLEFGRELREQPKQVTARVWSTYAEWKFRELNELPHVLKKRLRMAHAPARTYVGSFFNEHLVPVARMVAVCAGSTLLILVIFTVVEDRLLVANILGPFSGIWLIAVLSFCVAAAVACIPSQEHVFDPKGDMAKIREHTHYMPDSWRGREHTKEVRQQFECLYEYRVVYYLKELLSALILPYTLLVSLPRSADAVVSFFANFTEYIDGVGSVVVYASFDVGHCGDARYGAPSDRVAVEPCNQGKMEKSLLSFKANHPTWSPDDSVREYVANIVQRLPDGFATAPRSSLSASTLSPPLADPLLQSLVMPTRQRDVEDPSPAQPDLDLDSSKAHFDLSLSLSTLLDRQYLDQQRYR